MDVSQYQRESKGVYIGPDGAKYLVDELPDIKKDVAAAEKKIAAYDRLKDKTDWTGDDIGELKRGLESDKREVEILTALKARTSKYWGELE